MSERLSTTEAELAELVRSIEERAPQQLHDHIRTLVAERAPAYGRQRATMRWGLLVGTPALAAIAVVLVIALSSGGGSSLTLDRTVALTLQPPTMRAPSENPHNGAQLMASVDGVWFPYWEESFGLRTTGERVDRIDGRTVTTVFYADRRGRWVGYAIVAGSPAPGVSGGVKITQGGSTFGLHSEHGTHVVTWLRNGHLCVIAGHGMSAQTLVALASWQDNGKLAA